MFALVAGLLRLGFLASFISEPVLKGFIVGLALTIIAGQLPSLFGVGKGEGDFFRKIWDLLTHLGETNGWTLVIGVLSLALVLLLKRYVPFLPASLVAVLFGVLAVVVLGLEDKGVEPGADRTRAANLGAGLSSGMVVNGSLSKTAVNGAAGARSQVSGLVVAGLTVVTLLFLTGLFERLPEATLAAVVIVAVIELVDIPALVRLYRLWTRRLGSIYGAASRADFAAAMAALLGVLVFDTLPGMFIGIGVSLLRLLYRASRPNVAVLGRTPGDARVWVDRDRHPDSVAEPGVVVRVEGGLFFADVDHVRDRIRALAAPDEIRSVVLDAETVPFVDVTAAQMLVQLSRELGRAGVTLLLARDIGQVRDVLRRAGADDALGELYPTVEEAVAAIPRRG